METELWPGLSGSPSCPEQVGQGFQEEVTFASGLKVRLSGPRRACGQSGEQRQANPLDIW